MMIRQSNMAPHVDQVNKSDEESLTVDSSHDQLSDDEYSECSTLSSSSSKAESSTKSAMSGSDPARILPATRNNS